jgi:hypothetical protein
MTKEERDDRAMQANAERHARPNAKRFDRPYRDGPVFLNHFPALRTGLLSLSPFLFRPAVVRIEKATSRLRRTSRDKSSVYNPKLLKLAVMGRSLGYRIPHVVTHRRCVFNPALMPEIPFIAETLGKAVGKPEFFLRPVIRRCLDVVMDAGTCIQPRTVVLLSRAFSADHRF